MVRQRAAGRGGAGIAGMFSSRRRTRARWRWGSDQWTKGIDDQLRMAFGELNPIGRFRDGRGVGTDEGEHLLFQGEIIRVIAHFQHLDGVLDLQHF